MSKRKGRKPLNYDNPDEDSEPEEAGTMVKANEAEIKNRVIIVAKRRLTKLPPEGGVFNSLKAAECLKSQPSINLESTFAFLKNNSAKAATALPTLGAITSNTNLDSLNGKFSSTPDKNISNKINSAASQPKPDFSFKRACTDSVDSNGRHSLSLPTVKSNRSLSPSSTSGDNRRSSSLDVKELAQKDVSNPILERVKILNIECLQWAQQHIDENPMIDLRPVFKDYNQHFEAILDEFQKSETSKPKETNASSETLVKLQNHIKTKNQMENSKDAEKKLKDSPSSINDIYSPDSNAEMKSKISQSLDRLSYFSSLLENNSTLNETSITDASAPTKTQASPVIWSNNSEQSLKTQSPVSFNNAAPKSDLGSTGFAFSRSSSGSFSFGADASRTTPVASPVVDKPDKYKSPPSTGSFFKIPALENNCFSNPSLSAKESADAMQRSPFGIAETPAASAFSLSTGNSGTTQQKTETEEDADDEDQPPVVEVKPIIEEGAKYTARCKVFIKKEDNSYADKGIGTLSLKCIDSSNKYQLVIRAESTLGNILVNVLLSKDLPIQRTGKNNVLIVCLPTPESEPPPKVVLLRVKTEAEADELLKALKDAQV